MHCSTYFIWRAVASPGATFLTHTVYRAWFRKNSRIRARLPLARSEGDSWAILHLSYSLVRRWISTWTNICRNQPDRLAVIILRSNRIAREGQRRWSQTKSHRTIDRSVVVKSNSFVTNSFENGRTMLDRAVHNNSHTSFVPIRRIEWQMQREKNMIDIKTNRCCHTIPLLHRRRRRRRQRGMKLIGSD